MCQKNRGTGWWWWEGCCWGWHSIFIFVFLFGQLSDCTLQLPHTVRSWRTMRRQTAPLRGENKRASSRRAIPSFGSLLSFPSPNCSLSVYQMYQLAVVSIGLCVESQWLIGRSSGPSLHGGHLSDCGPTKKKFNKNTANTATFERCILVEHRFMNATIYAIRWLGVRSPL